MITKYYQKHIPDYFMVNMVSRDVIVGSDRSRVPIASCYVVCYDVDCREVEWLQSGESIGCME